MKCLTIHFDLLASKWYTYCVFNLFEFLCQIKWATFALFLHYNSTAKGIFIFFSICWLDLYSDKSKLCKCISPISFWTITLLIRKKIIMHGQTFIPPTPSQALQWVFWKIRDRGVSLSSHVCFNFFPKTQRKDFFMDRSVNLFFLWEEHPYLSLGPPRSHPTDGSLSSTLFPSYQFPKEILRIHQTCRKMATVQSSSVLGLVSSAGCCVKERTSQRVGTCGELVLFFLFHCCPVDYPTKYFIVSD